MGDELLRDMQGYLLVPLFKNEDGSEYCFVEYAPYVFEVIGKVTQNKFIEDYNKQFEKIKHKNIDYYTKEDCVLYFIYLNCRERLIEGCIKEHLDSGKFIKVYKQYLKLQ